MKIKTKMKNNSIALNVSPNPADLKTHENQDQNEKPFSCTQCHMNLTNPTDIENPSAALNATLNLRIC